MTRRIFKSIFIVAIAIFIACLTVIMGVLYEHFSSAQKTQLAAQTSLAAQGAANEGLNYFDGLKTSDYRITWIDPHGIVLYDNKADAKTMENHLDREEVQEAYRSGYGESTRYSSTLMERQFYSAQRLADGSVIRLSISQYSALAFLLMMIPSILIVLMIAVILSLFLASRLSRQIVKPLNALDLDEPLSNDTYEELAPLLTRIEQQHREIKRQTSELKYKRDEFSAVTDSMNEGLVLLNNKGIILSINNRAAQLLNTDKSCIGKDMLLVDRSLAIQDLLSKAQSGVQGEIIIKLAGGEYQLNASPVMGDGAVEGAVLLLFDVTEKRNAEQMRREFTANVSHELKTPLHSISGCAELLHHGMVNPGDVPQFTGQIYSEAQRMIHLVDDIIRLSHLDEGVDELPKEAMDLYAMIQNVFTQLDPYAKEKEVTLSLQGAHATIHGIAPLIRELIYNLCDNAIKYNRKGGKVSVLVKDEKDRAVLSVTDTGIGIPEGHQSRIFERFYRVDKSHSKESGGTGLGLSIVRHVALLHNAKIELHSIPEKGTAITVYFPK